MAKFVIWSIEHNAWWAPGRRGCTEHLGKAGVYDQADAQAICADANAHGAINELAIPLDALVGSPDSDD